MSSVFNHRSDEAQRIIDEAKQIRHPMTKAGAIYLGKNRKYPVLIAYSNPERKDEWAIRVTAVVFSQATVQRNRDEQRAHGSHRPIAFSMQGKPSYREFRFMLDGKMESYKAARLINGNYANDPDAWKSVEICLGQTSYIKLGDLYEALQYNQNGLHIPLKRIVRSKNI